MKNYFYKLLPMMLIIIVLLAACSGSRSMRHHGVNNKAYKGY